MWSVQWNAKEYWEMFLQIVWYKIGQGVVSGIFFSISIKYSWDVGNLWKMCCIKKYWEAFCEFF